MQTVRGGILAYSTAATAILGYPTVALSHTTVIAHSGGEQLTFGEVFPVDFEITVAHAQRIGIFGI